MGRDVMQRDMKMRDMVRRDVVGRLAKGESRKAKIERRTWRLGGSIFLCLLASWRFVDPV